MRDVDARNGLLPDLLAVPGGPCASQDGLFSIRCVICGERLLSQCVYEVLTVIPHFEPFLHAIGTELGAPLLLVCYWSLCERLSSHLPHH